MPFNYAPLVEFISGFCNKIYFTDRWNMARSTPRKEQFMPLQHMQNTISANAVAIRKRVCSLLNWLLRTPTRSLPAQHQQQPANADRTDRDAHTPSAHFYFQWTRNIAYFSRHKNSVPSLFAEQLSPRHFRSCAWAELPFAPSSLVVGSWALA